MGPIIIGIAVVGVSAYFIWSLFKVATRPVPEIDEDQLHGFDPVFLCDGKWYFWDEVWSEAHGPFMTEEQARENLETYAEAI